MNKTAEYFKSINEPFASGFLRMKENQNFTVFQKRTHAILNQEHFPNIMVEICIPAEQKIQQTVR